MGKTKKHKIKTKTNRLPEKKLGSEERMRLFANFIIDKILLDHQHKNMSYNEISEHPVNKT